LTGLSPHVLRAWERRYGAVQPLRSEGGTRRYRESDIARLKLLREAVDAGHPIGQVAGLSNTELERRAARAEGLPGLVLEPLLDALKRFDGPEAERLLALQLSALGPEQFARLVALPLLRQVGELWYRGRLCVGSEHLASAILRSLLGVALRPSRMSLRTPSIVFATPSGERHELGLLGAAVVTAGAGGNALFLGPDLPIQEVVAAARSAEAAAVAVGVTVLPPRDAQKALRSLRRELPEEVLIWVGGAGSEGLTLPPGVEHISDLVDLERKVALLATRS
jgi:DNA-binding transcriptional MerR regulator